MSGIQNISFLITVVLTGVLWIIGTYSRGREFLLILQEKCYENKKYMIWVSSNRDIAYQNKVKTFFKSIAILSTFYIIMLFYYQSYGFQLTYTIIWSILFITSIDFKQLKKKNIKPTPRFIRLIVGYYIFVLAELLVVVATYLLFGNMFAMYYPVILFTMALIYYHIPYNTCFGNLLMSPIEENIYKHNYKKAYKKIRGLKNLRTIGIASSDKDISMQDLIIGVFGRKYKIISTIKNSNNCIDVSNEIIEEISSDHQVFVVNLECNSVSETKALANIINPKIGLITSIDNDGTDINIETTLKAKYELIEALPTDGVAIFNYDNDYIKRLADKTFKEKILYGTSNIENLDIFATDIEVSDEWCQLIVNDNKGKSVKIRTKRVAKHSISNLLATFSVGKALGLTLEEICQEFTNYNYKIEGDLNEIHS